VRSLEAVVGQSAALVAEMASGVEAFQQHVLPTFKVPREARAGNEERAPLEGDRHGLGKQVSWKREGLLIGFTSLCGELGIGGRVPMWLRMPHEDSFRNAVK
jgi:hypothetical protein